MRYWVKRLKLLWKFVKVADMARELEIDIQAIEQAMNNTEFSNALNSNDKEKELAYQKGYWDGLNYALRRVK